MIKMKVIVPKKLFQGDRYKSIVEQELDKEAVRTKDELDRSAHNWKHKPTFAIHSSPVQRIIATDDEIYGFVNDGTRPHMILPRRARRLRFLTPYVAKTTPGVIGRFGGGHGNKVVFARAVRHPGFQARKFTKVAAREAQKRLALELRIAFAKEAGR